MNYKLSHDLYFSIMNIDELKENYVLLSLDTHMIDLLENVHTIENTIIPARHYLLGVMSLVNAKNIFLKKDILAFVIFKNHLLIVVIEDDDQHINDIFYHVYHTIEQSHLTLTRLIYYFLNDLINDYSYIERLQDDIHQLEQYNTPTDSLTFSNKLRSIHNELLLLRNYYESLVGIVEELSMDYLGFFDDDMRYFDILVRRMTRLSDNVALLQELSNKSRESHQFKLEYQMSKTMQLFTIVTTIFLPLSLIAGWYGMNFKYMPEINYRYSYLIVIGISLIIVALEIYWYKKRKYF